MCVVGRNGDIMSCAGRLLRHLGAVVGIAILALSSGPPAISQVAPTPSGPFAALAGWWSGEGRLGFKEGKLETVKCRATYASATADTLDQSIRCAAASGMIEVKANVAVADNRLTGQWTERIHNIAGDIKGEITPRGFQVTVTGDQLTAGMEIMVRGDKQIVEIQFHDSTLVGLTLVLQKGTAANRPPG